MQRGTWKIPWRPGLLEQQLGRDRAWRAKRQVRGYHVRVLRLDLLSQWLSIFKKLTLDPFPQKEFSAKASTTDSREYRGDFQFKNYE